MKVVFILGSAVNPNSLKRVDEFNERGYDISAYGFSRELTVNNRSSHLDVTIVGHFSNSTPYKQRIITLYNGVKNVISAHKEDNCIYYLVGLDMAIVFRLQSRKPYIFEEADMVHTNIKNKLVRGLLEIIDKRVIKHSVFSVFRSEGFLRYHFHNNIPDNVFIISNRLSPRVEDYPVKKMREKDFNHLRIGYVGFIRYESILNFAKVFCQHFPQHEFHFWGTFTNEKGETQFSGLKAISNCYFHGAFKSPNDLPDIYSNIDMVLSTYDVSSINVRYAEPNKIYEAIYFETPIIVSANTFLAEKVEKLGIGYSLDAMNEKDVVKFVNDISQEKYHKIKANIKKIDKRSVINNNDDFFEALNKQVNSL